MNDQKKWQTILIVEDDEDISRALKLRLTSAGYSVETAADGVLAITEAERTKPALIILDISMPGTSGIEAARKLREKPYFARTPMIFMTASKRPELRERAERVGAIGFLEKPYDPKELMALIDFTLASTPTIQLRRSS